MQAKQTENLNAYNYMLKGPDLNKSGNITIDRAEQAFEQFSKSVELAPGFARAHAWPVCSRSRTWSIPHNDEDTRECGEWIQTALKLDPDEAESHLINGTINRLFGFFDRADHHVERAITRDPNDAHILAKAVERHYHMGRLEEGDYLIPRAMRVYPYFPEWYWEIAGIIAYFGNEIKEALGHFGKVI